MIEFYQHRPARGTFGLMFALPLRGMKANVEYHMHTSRGKTSWKNIRMKNSARSRIQLAIKQLHANIGSRSSRVARLMVFSALIAIAACKGSPSHDSRPYCQGKPCLNAPLKKGDIGYRVLLVGDAGAPVERKNASPAQAPLLKALKYFAGVVPGRTAIVFLGDNIYEAGLPDETGRSEDTDEDCTGRACAEKRIDAQIDILKGSGARGIFVPGNHDWDGEGREGWKRVINLAEYIADSGKVKKVDVDFIPKQGCPGPITVPLSGEKVEISLIALDTQWWLHDYKKPGPEGKSSPCKQATEGQVIESIKKQVGAETGKQRHILLAAHHPLKSYGEHGAFYSLKDLIRPLYLLRQIGRKSIFAGRQNLHNVIYKNMRMKIQGAIHAAHGKEDTSLIYAAGHDHSLQIIKDEGGCFIWSAAPVRVGKRREWGKGRGLFSLIAIEKPEGLSRWIICNPVKFVLRLLNPNPMGRNANTMMARRAWFFPPGQKNLQIK